MSVSSQYEKLEADINTLCQNHKKNRNPFLATDRAIPHIKNYATITNCLFARIIGKISALTVLQYVNYMNNKPIGRIKYALN